MDKQKSMSKLNEAINIVSKYCFAGKALAGEDLQNVFSKLLYIKEELNDLEDVQNTVISRKITTRNKIKNRRDVCIVGCYLSKFGHEGLFNGLNQSQTFDKVAQLLNIKRNTLKGIRDIFDPLFNNGRVGWKDRPMKPEEKQIYKTYNKKSQLEFLNEVKQILKIN